MAEAGLQTLLLEGGGPSYGITGGDLDSRRPVRIKPKSRIRTRLTIHSLGSPEQI